MSKHNKGKAKHKPNNKPNTTIVTTIKHGEKDTVKLVDDNTGELIPTDDDKAQIERVKEVQRLYRQHKLEGQELLRKVKQEFEALNGSEALKALKSELEAKIQAKQEQVITAREAFKTLVSEYNSLTEEYKELTGISKKALKINDKSTGTHISMNGNWIPTVKVIDNDKVKIIVKYKPTNTVFEDTLYINGKGFISYENWIDLRKRFHQYDGSNPDKPKSVFYDLYESLDKNGQDNFRAFLYPRLYKLICEQGKPIEDKPVKIN